MAYVWIFPYNDIVDEIDEEGDQVPIQDSADAVDIKDPRVIQQIKENQKWHRKYTSDTNELKRGDIIRFEEQGYRNEGSYVWDGEKIVPLDDETISDQGTIPREFQVTKDEFYPGYWKDALDQGGGNFWLSPDLQDSIRFTKVDKNEWHGTLMHMGIGYLCIHYGKAPPSFGNASFCMTENGNIEVY